jgi:hypothetical protein
MKYIIKGEDGREYGPIDNETLRKWTAAGRVVPQTPVRNVLIMKWNKASDLDFLHSAFAVQGVREDKERSNFRKFSDHFSSIFGGGEQKKAGDTPWATAFKNRYIPDPATVSLRIAAFSFDFMLIAVFSIFLLMHFHASFKHPEIPRQQESASSETSPPAPVIPDSAKPFSGSVPSPVSPNAVVNAKAQETVQAAKEKTFPTPESEAEVNSAFNRAFYILVTCVLLYYGISLGLFAQTFGMWFWGMIIAKADLGEVLFFRAYFFTVLMLLFGVLSPFIVYFNPYRRSLHEMLSGTMVIRTAARPKS